MQLLPNEREIFNEGDYTLTNRRLIKNNYDDKRCIFLLDASFIGYTYTSKPWMLIVGIILAVAGFGASSLLRGYGLIILVPAAVLIGAFFLSRKKVIKVTAHAGESITWKRGGANVSESLSAIIAAKHALMEGIEYEATQVAPPPAASAPNLDVKDSLGF